MTQSKKRNIIIYLLIAFVCRVAQDLFNPYLSLDSYTNWRMWLLVIIDAAVLTIGLTLGEGFYRKFKEPGQKTIKLILILSFVCFLVYTFIKQKVFLAESALSIITIIIGAAWKTGMFVSGLVIIIGIARFLYIKLHSGR